MDLKNGKHMAIREGKTVSPSKQAGMGAVVTENGTTFRVWAPNADEVFVTGTFNDWAERDNPLASEENGYWSAHVPEAKAGDEYQYILVNGEQVLQRIDPYAKSVTNSVGNGVIYADTFEWNGVDHDLPAWNQVVIYELHVGTFGGRGEEGPGTFQDVIDKIPYLQKLGVNAIEVLPPMEFPGDFSWGYNPSHPFALESRYGGADGFKALVHAAHENNIAVIVDVVYNHFGPSDLSLWQFDGWSENDGGGIYFYNDWRSETPWGDTRPDYGRPEVRQYIRDNVMMWFEEYRVDGLRFDATAYMRSVRGDDDPANELPEAWSLLQWLNEEIDGVNPNALTIAEDLRGNAYITKSTGEGGAGFSSQWDSEFSGEIRSVVISPDDAFRDMEQVRSALERRFDLDAFTRVVYTESHDEVANGKARIPEEIQPGNVDNWFAKKRSSLAAALALTAPGIPMLFQGQEFLEDRWFHDKDPLEWERVERFEGLVTLYRDLIHLRRNADGTTAGLCGQEIDVYHVNNDDKIIAYRRWDRGGAGDDVIVVVNMANRTHDAYRLGFPSGGTWRLRLNSDADHYDPEFSNSPAADVTVDDQAYGEMPHSAELSIGPYTMLIFSQDRE